jgi:hypothetical protein
MDDRKFVPDAAAPDDSPTAWNEQGPLPDLAAEYIASGLLPDETRHFGSKVDVEHREIINFESQQFPRSPVHRTHAETVHAEPPQATEADNGESDSFKPRVLATEAIEPEAIEPEAMESEAVEPEEPMVVEPEVADREVAEPDHDLTGSKHIEPETAESNRIERETAESTQIEPESPHSVEARYVETGGFEPSVKLDSVKLDSVEVESDETISVEAECGEVSFPEPETLTTGSDRTTAYQPTNTAATEGDSPSAADLAVPQLPATKTRRRAAYSRLFSRLRQR